MPFMNSLRLSVTFGIHEFIKAFSNLRLIFKTNFKLILFLSGTRNHVFISKSFILSAVFILSPCEPSILWTNVNLLPLTGRHLFLKISFNSVMLLDCMIYDVVTVSLAVLEGRSSITKQVNKNLALSGKSSWHHRLNLATTVLVMPPQVARTTCHSHPSCALVTSTRSFHR